ncbi:MAG: hypothetical protein PHV05_13150, partial [Candidatus Riflebacteria bacterium]|nr:hypothetical protein [Candidatus Riflebacteria bacterium]
MKKRFGRALIFGLLCFLLGSSPSLASNLSSAYGYDPGEIDYSDGFQNNQNKVFAIPAPPESLLIVPPPPEFTFQQPEKAIKKKKYAVEPSRNRDIPVSKPAQMIPKKDIKKRIALPQKKTVEVGDSTKKIKPVISPELKRGKVVKPQMQQKSPMQAALSLSKIERKPVATASVSEIRVATKADTSADLPQGIFGVTSFEGGLRVESNSMLEGTPVE